MVNHEFLESSVVPDLFLTRMAINWAYQVPFQGGTAFLPEESPTQSAHKITMDSHVNPSAAGGFQVMQVS